MKKHGSDQQLRGFDTRHQFIALLHGQFSGAESLRAIETAMTSHEARLYRVGGKAPRRSTFADANRYRDPRVFSGLFEHMPGMANRKMPQEMKEVVRLIDSTSLHLAGVGAQWARFSEDVCGAKAHVIHDPDLGRPVYHSVTAANVNDITAAKETPIDAGATYVFDLGYDDYGWWAKLHEADCRIVTRFKTNTPLLEAKDLPLAAGSRVLSDRIGHLPGRQANSRKNPMQAKLRESVVMTDTGKKLRISSNDLNAPADEIADLHKRRRLIEWFFRLLKQTLRIGHVIGRSQNAIRIQIASAPIAHLILRPLQNIAKTKHGFLELTRLARANSMHRKSFPTLKEIQHRAPLDDRHQQMNLCNK